MWFWRNKQTRKYTHIHNAHIQKRTHVHSMFVFLCINLSNNINLSFCRLYVMISIKNVVLFSRDSIIRNVVTSDAFNLLMIVAERNWKFESEEIVFLFPFSRWFLYLFFKEVLYHHSVIHNFFTCCNFGVFCSQKTLYQYFFCILSRDLHHDSDILKKQCQQTS